VREHPVRRTAEAAPRAQQHSGPSAPPHWQPSSFLRSRSSLSNHLPCTFLCRTPRGPGPADPPNTFSLRPFCATMRSSCARMSACRALSNWRNWVKEPAMRAATCTRGGGEVVELRGAQARARVCVCLCVCALVPVKQPRCTHVAGRRCDLMRRR